MEVVTCSCLYTWSQVVLVATDQPVDVARELSGHATVFIQVVDCADVTPCFNNTVSATSPDSIARCSVDVVTGVEHGKLCDVESWCVCELLV